MKITFLGHAALLVEGNNFKALVDPFLTQNPQYKADETHTKDITHIFITHAHGDHLGDAVEIAKQTNGLIIANAEICNIIKMRHKDLNVHPMHIGGRFTFNFGTVKMTPALHGSSFFEDGIFQDAGNPCGYVIEHEDKAIYHAGDTGLTYDMKLLEDEEIEIAFLPIGGNYTMDAKDALKAIEFIRPKLTIPMHYNTFGLIQADPEQFKEDASLPVHIMQPGDTITI